jgi:hypothetical protein
MNFFSILTGEDLDAEQARGDAADAKLRELNERDYKPGGRLYKAVEETQGTDQANKNYAVVLDHLATSKTGDVNAQVRESFVEGLGDGIKNIFKPVSFVPWWFWAIAAVGVFAWLGGFRLFRRP